MTEVIKEINKFQHGGKLADYLLAHSDNAKSTYEYWAGAEKHVITIEGNLRNDKNDIKLVIYAFYGIPLLWTRETAEDLKGMRFKACTLSNNYYLPTEPHDKTFSITPIDEGSTYHFSENIGIVRKILSIHEDVLKALKQ